MKKVLLVLGLTSLCFGSYASSDSTIICKLKLKNKEVKTDEAKANQVGRVGKVRLSENKDGSNFDVKVSLIERINSKKQIEYMNEERATVDKESYDSQVEKFGFKSVSSVKALSTSNYFVYFNKKGLNNIQAITVNRETGERSVLERCERSGKFLSRLLKQ